MYMLCIRSIRTYRIVIWIIDDALHQVDPPFMLSYSRIELYDGWTDLYLFISLSCMVSDSGSIFDTGYTNEQYWIERLKSISIATHTKVHVAPTSHWQWLNLLLCRFFIVLQFNSTFHIPCWSGNDNERFCCEWLQQFSIHPVRT